MARRALALLAWALLGLSPLAASVAGAALSPTDPVLATTILHGHLGLKHLADRLRHVLSAEAGANDGLAAPLVLLPLTGMFARTVLWETLAGAAVGLLLGLATGKALVLAERRHSMELPSSCR